MFAESVTGVAHRRVSQECQDHCGFGVDAGGRLVAVVADGAGSAELGGLGASIAVAAALEHAVGHPDLPMVAVVEGAIGSARAALVDRAVEAHCELELMATTLIVQVADGRGSAVGQVGDGVALAIGADGEWLGFTAPQRGEFANDTVFLTGEDALGQAQFCAWSGPVSAVALLTDGLQRLALKLPSGRPHDPFFERIFALGADAPADVEAQLSALLRARRVLEKAQDDLTLVVGWRDGVADRPPDDAP